MKIISLLTLPALLLGFASCSKTIDESRLENFAPAAFSVTKSASDFSSSSFANNDRIGLYVVNAASPTLKPTGNVFDNKSFSVAQGIMIADKTEYYPVGVSSVNMYAYAPYSATGLTSDNKLSFSVQANQSATPAASDLLWVGKSGVSTTSAAPQFTFQHKLSKIIINLTAGVGVTLTTPVVKINNTLPDVLLDMSAGTLSAAKGTSLAITPAKAVNAMHYNAIIIPQQVTALANFITITNGGKTYNYTLSAAKTFDTTKVYTFNITVNANDLTVNISGTVGDWNVGDTIPGEAQ